MEKPCTLPDHFWDSMGDKEKSAVCELDENLGLILFPTGSRIHNPDNFDIKDDWDIFTLMHRNQASDLLFRKWGPNHKLDGKYEENSPLYRCYKGRLNLICTFTPEMMEFFRNMMLLFRDLPGSAETQHAQRKAAMRLAAQNADRSGGLFARMGPNYD